MKLLGANRTRLRSFKVDYVIYGLMGGFCLAAAGGFILGGQAPAPASAQGSIDLERYLTYVMTDKPIYRTGEKVYVSGTLLRAEGHLPGAPMGVAVFEIKGPKGDTVTSGTAGIVDSIAGFSWDIPANQAGGEYTVRILPGSGDAPAERKFDIRAYRAPRLKSQIVFVRDGYGPGDTVAASLHVDRAEGGVPAGARVSVSARVDGDEVWKGETAVDASGNASANFKLPLAIARGEGTLAMTIQDGGVVETASKTIPILLQTLDLAIYPEGGDLVAGLTNRVYVEGRTPAQKPADMAGVILNAAGREVAAFRTEHEGRGRFSFVPAPGETYSLRVTEPAGIKTVFRLPAVKASGVVMATPSDVTQKQKDVVVRVAATAAGNYRIVLGQRGKEFAEKPVTLRSNQPADVTINVPKALDGVIVATVYDETRKPMAERLLFRQPEHNLKVQVSADRADYVPGDKVTLRVATTDDAGKPVSALVGLTVTDSSVLEMIDKREQAPRLPVMVLLENDVKNLADAHVYLDAMNPKAPLATDLLLGTQGWRRFATVDSTAFVTANGDAARRILGMKNQREEVVLRLLEEALFKNEGVVGGVPGGVPGGVVGGVPRPVFGAPPPPPPPLPAAVRAPVPAPFIPPPAVMPPVPGQGQGQGQGQGRGAEPAAGGGGGGRGGGLADRANPALARQRLQNPMLTVREYAHALRPNWTEGSRVDFSETVYWNAGIKTDASTGVATVAFNLSDAVTAFRVLADGVTSDGVLGSSVSDVESVQPFFIEPKLPLQITSGDVVQMPVAIVNGLNRELRGTEITAKVPNGLKTSILGDTPTALHAKERSRRIMQIEVGAGFNGFADLTLDANAGPYRDTVSRKIDVQPMGFPYEKSSGGILESNGATSFEFTLPVDMVRGSATSSVTVYPTPLASMTDALQGLLRQPNGCFEQTSSTSYPLVMAQQYFLTHTGVDAAVVEKARDLLEASYKRLTGFESRSKGYEWFGADPGHEALTAYGLLQFTDMSQVRNVDKEMVDRTRAWLLARRDGNGGFSVNAKALDSFGRAPADTTNAYVTWALVESGQKGLEKEIAAVKASANSSADTYIVALAANILHATGDRAGARQLMDKLTKSQETGGNVKGAGTSITRSGGEALVIEATALSVLAWLREPSYAANVEKGLRWIVETNKNGRFGSTQSTILALRSIIAYDAAHARPKAPGRVVLVIDGKPMGSAVAFTAETKGAIALPEFASTLAPGKHTASLRMEDGSDMPFSMNVKYYSLLPDSSPQTQVGIQVALRNPQIQEGGVTEVTVSIANKSDEAIPTPVAIVGIPGGLEVRHDQLKELVKSGRIDAYEVIGREVVLYWRVIKAKDRFDLPLSLVAAIPGTYTGPASRAYLYYTDEYKNWVPGLQVNIKAR